MLKEECLAKRKRKYRLVYRFGRRDFLTNLGLVKQPWNEPLPCIRFRYYFYVDPADWWFAAGESSFFWSINFDYQFNVQNSKHVTFLLAKLWKARSLSPWINKCSNGKRSEKTHISRQRVQFNCCVRSAPVWNVDDELVTHSRGQKRHTSYMWTSTIQADQFRNTTSRKTSRSVSSGRKGGAKYLWWFDLTQTFPDNMALANCDGYYCRILGTLQPGSADICSSSLVRSSDQNMEGNTQGHTLANLEVLFELEDRHLSKRPLLKVFLVKSVDLSKSQIPIASRAIAWALLHE